MYSLVRASEYMTRIFIHWRAAIGMVKKKDGSRTIHDPVYIEDGVFIGAGSIILKGVRIGKNSIVGAGSVVAKSIPEGEIWAGNPAKRVRESQ